MILTFTKLDGYKVGIDADNITDVIDNGHTRTIGTVTDEFDVIESYSNIVSVINQVRNSFTMKFYNN